MKRSTHAGELSDLVLEALYTQSVLARKGPIAAAHTHWDNT